jgi:hypothetical protein
VRRTAHATPAPLPIKNMAAKSRGRPAPSSSDDDDDADEAARLQAAAVDGATVRAGAAAALATAAAQKTRLAAGPALRGRAADPGGGDEDKHKDDGAEGSTRPTRTFQRHVAATLDAYLDRTVDTHGPLPAAPPPHKHTAAAADGAAEDGFRLFSWTLGPVPTYEAALRPAATPPTGKRPRPIGQVLQDQRYDCVRCSVCALVVADTAGASAAEGEGERATTTTMTTRRRRSSSGCWPLPSTPGTCVGTRATPRCWDQAVNVAGWRARLLRRACTGKRVAQSNVLCVCVCRGTMHRTGAGCAHPSLSVSYHTREGPHALPSLAVP